MGRALLPSGLPRIRTLPIGIPVRLQAPMCLSAHPRNVQLSDEDILGRSGRNV